MKIASGSTDKKIYFVAVSGTDFVTRLTGLGSFVVSTSRNGSTPQTVASTVAECDASLMPGVYQLDVDQDTTIASVNDTEEMVYQITASGMAPVTRTIELYRPLTTVGETIDVTAGAIDAVNEVGTTSVNLDMRGTDGANTVAPDNASIASIDSDVSDLASNQGQWVTATGFTTTADLSGLATTSQLNGVNSGILLTINNLNDFSPATDVVAHVTLVDTTTDLTNGGGGGGGDATSANQAAIQATCDNIQSKLVRRK